MSSSLLRSVGPCETVGKDLYLLIQLMLFLKREYVEDSDESSSGSEEASAGLSPAPGTSVPVAETQGWVAEPLAQPKAKEQKVGIYIPEPPSKRPVYQRARPGSANTRPETGNAAMRTRMMEQQKNPPTNNRKPSRVSADQALDDLDKLLQKPIGPTAFNARVYEPALDHMNVLLPAAVSFPKTVFKAEAIEETKLEDDVPATVSSDSKSRLESGKRFAFVENSPVKPTMVHEGPEQIESIWGPPNPQPEPVSPVKPTMVHEGPEQTESIWGPLNPQPEPVSKKPAVLPQAEEVKEEFLVSRPTTAATPHRANSLPATDDSPKLVPQPVLVRELLQDMRKFLTSPLPRNVTVLCSIRRDSRGIKKRFYPKYLLHLSEGNTFLLAGKKRANSKTSNYLLSMNKDELSTHNPAYLGKLRSNFIGTQFVIYDTGLDPAKKSARPDTIREELGVILYESNLLASKGPRKMRVLLPFVNLQNERLECRPTKKGECMAERYNQGDSAEMLTFFNKPPKWNDHIQAFVLNFNGRVDRASVKNFQLIDDQDESQIYLQFGRVGDKDFNLDFQWPFSPLQAFAIALSSFDYKIACE